MDMLLQQFIRLHKLWSLISCRIIIIIIIKLYVEGIHAHYVALTTAPKHKHKHKHKHVESSLKLHLQLASQSATLKICASSSP